MRYQTIVWQLISVLFFTFHIGGLQAETQIESISVTEQIFPKYQILDAVVEAVNHSTVSSRISAQVIEINYDVNDVVPKGAVIMKFQDAEFQARVAQIKAAILADKAQSREAIARQKEAKKEAKRVKSLYARKLISQADLDRANANLSAANARVQALQAQAKSRQAQLDEAKVQLSYTQIIAPYSGIVTERFIELGEMVSPGQHLMSGVSLEHLRAIVSVPQYLLPTIISAVEPELSLADGRKIKGQKVTVLPQADAKSHSFKVRIDLPEKLQAIYPGIYGKLRFKIGEEKITMIKQSAIVQRSEVSGVYIINRNQKLSLRQIRLGRHLPDGQREILAGLSVGEKVASDPLQAAILLKEQAKGLADE